jgi:hypothetical protein
MSLDRVRALLRYHSSGKRRLAASKQESWRRIIRPSARTPYRVHVCQPLLTAHSLPDINITTPRPRRPGRTLRRSDARGFRSSSRQPRLDPRGGSDSTVLTRRVRALASRAQERKQRNAGCMRATTKISRLADNRSRVSGQGRRKEGTCLAFFFLQRKGKGGLSHERGFEYQRAARARAEILLHRRRQGSKPARAPIRRLIQTLEIPAYRPTTCG